MIENALAGIVLTAQSFNPSIFTETWLGKNGVLDTSKLTGVRVFSPEFAQFQTDDVQVLVVPPKMQIGFPVNASDIAVPRSMAIRVVELLPHTPYQALGLNFDYFVSQPEGRDFGSYDRELLGTGEYSLIQEFTAGDARFGRYLSKDFGSARLRLDIKPIKAGPQKSDMLYFSFNFHHEIGQVEQSDRPTELVRLIGTWDVLRAYSEKITEMGSQPRS